MQDLVRETLNKVVDGICTIAKANVACATGFIGYQREVPQQLRQEEPLEDK